MCNSPLARWKHGCNLRSDSAADLTPAPQPRPVSWIRRVEMSTSRTCWSLCRRQVTGNEHYESTRKVVVNVDLHSVIPWNCDTSNAFMHLKRCVFKSRLKRSDSTAQSQNKSGSEFFFSPLVVKIPRAKNIKLNSKVGMARGPVLHRQKQSSQVLRPNWNAVQDCDWTVESQRFRRDLKMHLFRGMNAL